MDGATPAHNIGTLPNDMLPMGSRMMIAISA